MPNFLFELRCAQDKIPKTEQTCAVCSGCQTMNGSPGCQVLIPAFNNNRATEVTVFKLVSHVVQIDGQ